MTAPKIALCMIVRNESAVIERCLASVRDLIDTWVVCDTGSTDATPELVQSTLVGIPGQLHHRPWVDFGHNRSELMQLARGSADYLLLLDADMTLHQHAPLPPLDADAYLVRHTGALAYSVPRLVRGDRLWRFEGATHEYLASDASYSQETLAVLVVDHHGDGGARHDKLRRDRALLERELARSPSDPRTLFYLAQTYRDLGDRARAIDLYRQRVAAGGWDEEVFYAQYQVGALLVDGDWDAAIPELLRAWELRPRRAEPFYELARGYRFRGQHQLAQMFARRGLEVPLPDDILFVHGDVYDWALRFEHSVAAYWNGDFHTALADNDELLASGAPAHIEAWVHHNRDWCLRALGIAEGSMSRQGPLALERVALLGDLVPTARVDALVIPSIDDWRLLNPTVAPCRDGFRMIVRSVNYDLVDGTYGVLDPDGVVRTRNYQVMADKNLSITSVTALPMVPDGPPVRAGVVVGCEDCRLIEIDGRWYASTTVRDRNAELMCEMALLSLTDETVDGMVMLPSPDRTVHEKNWMPFVHEGELHFLYSCAPTVVLRCDPTGGTTDIVSEREGPAVAAGFRGGSQGVPVDAGWLFFVHETAHVEGVSRTYVHRLVRLNHAYELDAVSRPFAFIAPGVEFCAGFAARGDDAVVTFGVDDRGAYAARVQLPDLIGLLEPVGD